MDVLALPPLTGSALLDPWRIRHRLAMTGELAEPPRKRDQRTTLSERMLWSVLEPEPDGWQREYATGPFRLDFYCPLGRLAVEVDGGSHFGRQANERDSLRDEWHRTRQITTMRVSADHVERDLPGVLEEIRQRLRLQLGLPEPAPRLEDDAAERPASAPSPGAAPALTAAGADLLEDATALRDDPQVQFDAYAVGLQDGLPSVSTWLATEQSDTVEWPDDVVPTMQDLEQEAADVAALIRLELLPAEVGGSTQAAELKTQRLIAQACRTILPAQQDQFVQIVLRRAGLSRPVARQS